MKKHTSISVMVGFVALGLVCRIIAAREYHVTVTGSDRNDGSVLAPLKSISAAASMVEPGDVVTVHAGTYRERISPQRGGSSESARIVYQAASGEKVVIKGSEIIQPGRRFKTIPGRQLFPTAYSASSIPTATSSTAIGSMPRDAIITREPCMSAIIG